MWIWCFGCEFEFEFEIEFKFESDLDSECEAEFGSEFEFGFEFKFEFEFEFGCDNLSIVTTFPYHCSLKADWHNWQLQNFREIRE